MTPSVSKPISIANSGLRSVIGATDLADADAAVLSSDRGLVSSFDVGADSDSLSWEGHDDVSRSFDYGEPTGVDNPYTHLAAEGDWDLDAIGHQGQELYRTSRYAMTDLADRMLMSDEAFSWSSSDSWASDSPRVMSSLTGG